MILNQRGSVDNANPFTKGKAKTITKEIKQRTSEFEAICDGHIRQAYTLTAVGAAPDMREEMKEGDLVLIKRDHYKFDIRWEGPFSVEYVTDSTVKVHGRSKPVAMEFTKRYYSFDELHKASEREVDDEDERGRPSTPLPVEPVSGEPSLSYVLPVSEDEDTPVQALKALLTPPSKRRTPDSPSRAVDSLGAPPERMTLRSSKATVTASAVADPTVKKVRFAQADSVATSMPKSRPTRKASSRGILKTSKATTSRPLPVEEEARMDQEEEEEEEEEGEEGEGGKEGIPSDRTVGNS